MGDRSRPRSFRSLIKLVAVSNSIASGTHGSAPPKVVEPTCLPTTRCVGVMQRMQRRVFLSTAIASITGGAAVTCAEDVRKAWNSLTAGAGGTSLRSNLDKIQA